MNSMIRKAACLAFWLLLAGVLPAQAEPAAGPSVVPVGPRHYSGTWLEIARRPMWLTDGCVAGYTTYTRGAGPSEIAIEDGCREGTPSGKLKTVSGRGALADAAGARAKLKVRYPLFITFDYWVLYEAPDHSWFISADPQLENLWIYARTIPTKAKLAKMVGKAKTLGYDVGRLEFPPQR